MSAQKHGIQKIEEWKKLGKADVHIHTNISDARPSIQEVLDYVQNQTDLDVIAISDHDTIEGALLARQLMNQKYYRFDLIVGEEITSQEGHILGLFLTETIPAGLSAEETCKAIHAQGGLAIAAHPFKKSRFKNPKLATMDGVGGKCLIECRQYFDGLEVVNATPTLSDENLSASLINKTLLAKAETGSSDAHILEAIGKGYTLFEGKNAPDLKRALKKHQTQGLYASWTILALLKYLFFFVPPGWRIFINTLRQGRMPKREDFNHTK